jgi:hypothetical protein
MNWENIIKQDEEDLLPVLEKLLIRLKNRIHEMEGVLRDSEEEDEADLKADYILDMAKFAVEKVKGAEKAVERIDSEYEKLVEILNFS